MIEGCKGYLQQGDIFKLKLVGTHSVADPRIVRRADGKKITFERTPTVPVSEFPIKMGLLPEKSQEYLKTRFLTMRYFVIASQNCDISGLDRPANKNCVILPYVSYPNMFRERVFPYRKQKKGGGDEVLEINVRQFIKERLWTGSSNDFEICAEDDFKWMDLVQNLLKTEVSNKDDNEIRKRLKNMANADWLKNKGIAYQINGNKTLSVPPGYIDLENVFSIETGELLTNINERLGALKDLHREAFGQSFGARFSRVATPVVEPVKI